MRKKILFLISLTFLIRINASALTYGGCDYSSISRLKSLVGNINISYDYHIDNNQAYFDVTLTNITPDMYFLDTTTGITYTYNDTKSGDITIYNYTSQSGSYKFYSNLSNCESVSIGIKYYKFPIYNIYYTDSLCADIPNYILCQKWVSMNYSYDDFKILVEEYKNSLNVPNIPNNEVQYNSSFLDKLINLYINYYYFFLVAIILVCGSIILIKQKDNKFKL